MAPTDSPYVFRGSPEDGAERPPPTTHGQEVVIVDGRAMSYRWYRR